MPAEPPVPLRASHAARAGRAALPPEPPSCWRRRCRCPARAVAPPVPLVPPVPVAPPLPDVVPLFCSTIVPEIGKIVGFGVIVSVVPDVQYE